MKAASRLLAAAGALALIACAGDPARPEASWFRGDRVTVDRDFIYLDDPVFLHSAEAYGHRSDGAFSFRLPLYFHARAGDSVRFGPGAATVRPAPDRDGSRPAPLACAVDTSDDAPDSAQVAARLSDTTRSVTLVVHPDAEAALAVHCLGYRPPWGRVDTLDLVFARRGPGSERMLLPFHVSYHGPVVSILLGSLLLFAFTEAGLWASRSR
jgi:hypothetical protein